MGRVIEWEGRVWRLKVEVESCLVGERQRDLGVRRIDTLRAWQASQSARPM